MDALSPHYEIPHEVVNSVETSDNKRVTIKQKLVIILVNLVIKTCFS